MSRWFPSKGNFSTSKKYGDFGPSPCWGREGLTLRAEQRQQIRTVRLCLVGRWRFRVLDRQEWKLVILDYLFVFTNRTALDNMLRPVCNCRILWVIDCLFNRWYGYCHHYCYISYTVCLLEPCKWLWDILIYFVSVDISFTYNTMIYWYYAYMQTIYIYNIICTYIYTIYIYIACFSMLLHLRIFHVFFFFHPQTGDRFPFAWRTVPIRWKRAHLIFVSDMAEINGNHMASNRIFLLISLALRKFRERDG